MSVLFEEKTWQEKIKGISFVVIIIGAITLAVFFLKGQDLVIRDPQSFQAVFLDNSQVYFGKLRRLNGNFWSLTDIYYLRAGTAVQTAGTEGTAQIELIKLGAELHAPRDEMIINKEHVVFYEQLGENGEVMKLVRAHKQGNNQ